MPARSATFVSAFTRARAKQAKLAMASSIPVAITISNETRNAGIDARTKGGNLIIRLPADFGGRVEATILTTAEAAHTIISAFPGLTIVRDDIGGRVRIRATGRLNAGGNRIVLYAEDGNIQILRR